MRKCNTCGGTYAPIGTDGVEYYHACPPLSVAEIKAAIVAKTVTLSPAAQARVDAATAADTAAPPALGALSRVDQVLASFTIERANKRDENVVPPIDDKGKSTLKAAGGGVTDVGPATTGDGVVAAHV